MTARTTILHDIHRELGARMIEFGGWDMPVSYTDITTEHQVVRTKAGLFDLCHMGRIRIHGEDAIRLVQMAQTNDVEKIPLGRIRYGLMLLETGGVIDDILVHRRANDVFLVVNASNRERDVKQLTSLSAGMKVVIDDLSDEIAMLAVQGPKSAAIVALVAPGIDVAGLKYYGLAEGLIDGTPGMITRTGYTGEDGFELYVPIEAARALWARCLEAGREFEMAPCGLGARDTLRLEAGMPLYGHEISETINPIEADLMFGVRLQKPAFVGRDALLAIDAAGANRRIAGLVVEGRRIPRQGHPVLAGGGVVGEVLSGTWSPTFDCAIATALVSSDAEPAPRFEVDIRGKPSPARRVALPFYKRDGSGSLMSSSTGEGPDASQRTEVQQDT